MVAGAGKSLFMFLVLLAHHLPSVGVVISPLNSLMDEQVLYTTFTCIAKSCSTNISVMALKMVLKLAAVGVWMGLSRGDLEFELITPSGNLNGRQAAALVLSRQCVCASRTLDTLLQLCLASFLLAGLNYCCGTVLLFITVF